MSFDKDLVSIQQVRDLMKKATQAQHELATFNQEKIDTICLAITEAAYANREKLAKMANEETGFGIWEDKVVKNTFASKSVWEAIKDMKTIGEIKVDHMAQVTEVAVPMGVVAGIIPSTNPTSTVIYKALISIKSGNSMVVSPHPNALQSILETVKIIEEAAIKAGAPEGTITVISTPTMQATDALMKHPDTAIILATGGSAMVKAAYSSGNPAIGVGPGNGPAFIEQSADVSLAVHRIMDSKTFDNGTICASEQSVIVEQSNKVAVMSEFKKQGAYFLSAEEAAQLAKFVLRANGSMNPAIVGKSVAHIAKLANLTIPVGARVLIAEETEVGNNFPYSREKLAPILGFYTVNSSEEALSLSTKILMNEGAGHSMMIHSTNEAIIREFGLKSPVSRLMVNAGGALGGVGASTNLFPAFTLGCGAVGGSSTSDNISPENLFNIKRVAYGVRELADLRETSTSSASNVVSGQEELVDLIVNKILERLQ